MDVSFDQYQIEVRRPADTDGLGRTQGSAETIYDGAADIQEQAVTRSSGQGGVRQIGDAQGFISGSVSDWQPGDTATVTRPDGSEFEATVADVTPLDDSFVLSKNR